MNLKASIFLFGLLACTSASAKECIKVSYIPFDRELYAPEDEKTIAARAQKHGFIAITEISRLFDSKQAIESDYEPNNTRVEMSYSGHPVFIDRDGVMRYKDKYYFVLVDKFVSMISVSCME